MQAGDRGEGRRSLTLSFSGGQYCRGVKRSLVSGRSDLTRVGALFPVAGLLFADARWAYEDDAGHRVVVDALHVPPLANGALRSRQLGIAVPAAPLARSTDGLQRFTNIDGKPLGFCQVIHNRLRPPSGIVPPSLETRSPFQTRLRRPDVILRCDYRSHSRRLSEGQERLIGRNRTRIRGPTHYNRVLRQNRVKLVRPSL
jgi:hypothetical protein